MKTSGENLIGFLKKVLMTLFPSALLSVGLVFAIGFFLMKTPHYENYYFLVPYVFMALSALVTAFVAKFFKELDMTLALTTSGLMSIGFFISGFLMKWSAENIPGVLGRIAGFIVLTALFTVLFRNKKKKSKSKGGKFRFSK